MTAPRYRRNVAVLAGCWTFYNICFALIFATAPLIGYAIADNKTLATLPVTAMLVGIVATTVPASLYMRRVGRRTGFATGSLIGTAGGAVALIGVIAQDFVVFCLGGLLFGCFAGFAQYYRFAAAEAAPAQFRSRAISYVIAAGVIGAFVGPELAKLGRVAPGTVPFTVAYGFVTLSALVSAGLVLFLDQSELVAGTSAGPRRPLREIARQPAFVVAVSSATVSFVVMALMMVASPLAILGVGHSFDDSAFVIQWHIVAMFAPGFVTGSLIARFGVLPVIGAGLALFAVSILIAVTGTTVTQFFVAMLLLGIGWNFGFTGGTALLTQVHTPAERASVQAANDFVVFGSNAAAAAASGALYHLMGWTWLNLTALPFVAIAATALIWLAFRRRGAETPA